MIKPTMSVDEFIIFHKFEVGTCKNKHALEVIDFGYFKSIENGHMYATIKFKDCCDRTNSFAAKPANAKAKAFYKEYLG